MAGACALSSLLHEVAAGDEHGLTDVFGGVVLCGTGCHGAEKRQLLQLGDLCGYRYCGDLVAGLTTHLVVWPAADLRSLKLARAREWGIPCVTLAWLLDSVARAALQPTAAYAVEEEEEAQAAAAAPPKRPSSVASNLLPSGGQRLAGEPTAEGSTPGEESDGGGSAAAGERPALQSLGNVLGRLRKMSISPQPPAKPADGSPQQSLSFQGMLAGARSSTPRLEVCSGPPAAAAPAAAAAAPSPFAAEPGSSPMEASPACRPPAQQDAFWRMVRSMEERQGGSSACTSTPSAPSPAAHEMPVADGSGGAASDMRGVATPGCDGGLRPDSGGDPMQTPASQPTVQAARRGGRGEVVHLRTPASVRHWPEEEDEEGGASDCGPPTVVALAQQPDSSQHDCVADSPSCANSRPAEREEAFAGQPLSQPGYGGDEEDGRAEEPSYRGTQPAGSLRDWPDDDSGSGSDGGSDGGGPTPPAKGRAAVFNSGLTQRDPASIVVSRPAPARPAAGHAGAAVEPGRLLARPPRGNLVREHHALKSLKGVVFAEQVHIPAACATLSTKEKKTAAKLRLPGPGPGEGEEEVVLAEPQALYCLPDGAWRLEYHRLVTGAQAEALAALRGAPALKLPAGFDHGSELLRSIDREHAPLAAADGSVVVRKLKQAGPTLKLQGTRTQANAYFWRYAVDLSAGTVLTDWSATHFIA